MAQPTRNALINWGNGSAEGEYLAAAILLIEDYESVDPSHPQGGPDLGKDLKCQKEGLIFVGACYFPPDSTQKKFTDLRNKFKADLKGVKKHGPDGFLFLTNMKVSLKERKTLEALAQKDRLKVCNIYHLEKIRALLDSPLGYGAREKFLAIVMSDSERTSALQADKVKTVARMDQRIAAQKKLLKQSLADKKNLISQIKKGMLQGFKSGRKIKRKKGARKVI